MRPPKSAPKWDVASSAGVTLPASQGCIQGMKKSVVLAAAALVGTLVASPSEALSLHSIRGEVRDAWGNLLRSTDPRGAASVSHDGGAATTTNADGVYLLEAPTTGDYKVKVTRSDIDLASGTVTVAATPLTTPQDFTVAYKLSATPYNIPLSTRDGDGTLRLTITTHAPAPGVAGEAGKSCIEVKDTRTGTVTPATFSSLSGTLATWTWAGTVPQGTSEGGHALTAVARDCASGIAVTKATGSWVTYTVDNTPPSIPSDSLVPFDGGNSMFATGQPLAARISDTRTGVNPSSIRFKLFDDAGKEVASSTGSFNAATGWASTPALTGLLEGRLYSLAVTARDAAGNTTTAGHRELVAGGGFLATHATGASTIASIPSTSCDVAAEPDAFGMKEVWCRGVRARLNPTTVEVGGMRHVDTGYLSQTFALDSAVVTTTVGGVKVSLPARRTDNDTWAPRTRSQRFTASESSNTAGTLAAEAADPNIGLLQTKVPATWTSASIEMPDVSTTASFSACANPVASTGRVPCSTDAFDARFIVRLTAGADRDVTSIRHGAEHDVVVREKRGQAYSAYIPPESLQAVASDADVVSVTRETYRSELFPDDWDGSGADIDELVPRMRAAFGTRYGGDWIDRSAMPSVWRVAVKDMTTADVAEVSRIAGGNDRVAAVSVAHSEEDFDGFVETAQSVLSSHGVVPQGILPDIIRRTLTVQVVALDALTRNELEAALPPGLLQVQFVPTGNNRLLHKTRMDGVPLEGGLAVGFTNAEGETPEGYLGLVCSTPFAAFRGGDPTQFFGVSAGHCGRVNDGVIFNPYGAVSGVNWVGFKDGGTTISDALTFVLQPDQVTGRVMVDLNDQHRAIDAEVDDDEMTLNRQTCFQGWASGRDGVFDNCGLMVQPMITGLWEFEDRKTTILKAFCFRGAWSQTGDSGGSVYDPEFPVVQMMGVLTGGSRTQVTLSDGSTFIEEVSCFTSVNAFTEASGGLHVHYGQST